ncbi:MAG: hypothetical protein C0459_01440 [Chitinophaga sp.]|jgi:hypothetical protein|nr:hypothetical protein [Chitinophaga sp.]
MDLLGEILWFAMFFTPIFTIPLVWRKIDGSKIYRVLFGLFIALIISFFLYFISLAIIFRNGLGPT